MPNAIMSGEYGPVKAAVPACASYALATADYAAANSVASPSAVISKSPRQPQVQPDRRPALLSEAALDRTIFHGRSSIAARSSFMAQLVLVAFLVANARPRTKTAAKNAGVETSAVLAIPICDTSNGLTARMAARSTAENVSPSR